MSVFTVIKRTGKYCGGWIVRHLPEIETGVGILLNLGGTVWACKQTLKANDIIEEYKQSEENVKECLDSPDIQYDAKDAKKDRIMNKVQTGKGLAKTYIWPALMIGGGITLEILGCHTLRKENLVLAGALAAATKVNQKTKELIPEPDIPEGEKQEAEVDDDGTIVVPGHGYSIYARIFDENNDYWSKDYRQRLMFLKQVQGECNNLLQADGYLYLSTVYKKLGLDEDRVSRRVGWVRWSEKGDNYVDFGIFADDGTYDAKNDVTVDYCEGIVLDFNVDGPIDHVMDKSFSSFVKRDLDKAIFVTATEEE